MPACKRSSTLAIGFKRSLWPAHLLMKPGEVFGGSVSCVVGDPVSAPALEMTHGRDLWSKGWVWAPARLAPKARASLKCHFCG